jgi:hypothetical protein
VRCNASPSDLLVTAQFTNCHLAESVEISERLTIVETQHSLADATHHSKHQYMVVSSLISLKLTLGNNLQGCSAALHCCAHHEACQEGHAAALLNTTSFCQGSFRMCLLQSLCVVRQQLVLTSILEHCVSCTCKGRHFIMICLALMVVKVMIVTM